MTRARHRVRAEIEIDAPIERVWQVLKHVDRYGVRASSSTRSASRRSPPSTNTALTT